MSKKPQNPAETPDDESPELTRAELRKARPAHEVLPSLIGQAGRRAPEGQGRGVG